MAATSVLVGLGSSKVLSRINRNALAMVVGRRWISQAATYHETLSVPETKVSTLKNRLRVATEENGSGSATVGIWVDAGSRYENEKNNGVAHFLEHMSFRGTSKRSQLDLEIEVENLGMNLNSHVSRDQMAFYAKCLSKDVPKAVEILSDIIQNSTFSEPDIEKERTAILREMQVAETNLTTVVMDYLHATAYQGTSLSQSVFGSTNSVKHISRTDLTNFAGTHYKPTRMVLAGAGGVGHDQLVQLAEKHFGGMTLNYEHEIPVLPPHRFTGSEIKARYDDQPLAHVALAIEGPGRESADNIPMLVASALIGSWDRTVGAGASLSSRLASACAQEELCHSFQSFNISYHNTGLWGAYFVADRMTIDDMFFNLQGEWMRICTSVSEFEVERAKNLLKTALMGQQGETTLVCEDIAKQFLSYGRHIPLAELDARIDSVNAKTVRDVCYKYVYDKCPAMAAYGPTEQVPDYNRLRAAMYWLRY